MTEGPIPDVNAQAVAAGHVAQRADCIVGTRAQAEFVILLDSAHLQPIVEDAFGFSITNRAPINSSLKSMTAELRNGREILSITTDSP